MRIERPRATGFYAVFQGREFHATTAGTTVILRTYVGEPDAADFLPSRIPSVSGIRGVERAELENLSYAKVVCRWRGEPFMIVGIAGDQADVFYIGERGEWAAQQPGLIRTGKLETHGRLPLGDLSDIHELVNPIPL